MSDMPDDLDLLLAEQLDYYRARAGEYDATTGIDESERARLTEAVLAFDARGRVLELACGTGQWTEVLARTAAELTAVDASAEMLELNRVRVARPRVRYVQADLFDWSPTERYDVVFFAAWLSHVPPQRFEALWALVGSALADGGRVFVIDELPAVSAIEDTTASAPAPTVRRELTTGASYRAVKVLYEPDELVRRAAELGFELEVSSVGWRFFVASGRRG